MTYCTWHDDMMILSHIMTSSVVDGDFKASWKRAHKHSNKNAVKHVVAGVGGCADVKEITQRFYQPFKTVLIEFLRPKIYRVVQKSN